MPSKQAVNLAPGLKNCLKYLHGETTSPVAD